MRQIVEILRLKHQHQLTIREIARSCGLPSSTVGDYLQRAESAKIGWPLPDGLCDSELECQLLGEASKSPQPVTHSRPMPDWAHIREELRRPNVTLLILWKEYQETNPEGLKYSRFCDLYRRWSQTLEPTLRQVHLPGQRMFVDWAGQQVPIRQSSDHLMSMASLFVAVMGASNKMYVEAFPDQKLGSWIQAHVHAWAFYGGVAALTVPDNARTAVIKGHRYEAQLHRTYQEMAEHYGTVILPTRPHRPRDKAKVETAVQIAQRQILAPLRDMTFFSLGELNEAVHRLLQQINSQPFQKLEGSRNECFESMDRPKLKPLPLLPFVLATWSKAKVNIDYHVVVDHHYYSVPYPLIHQELEARLTETSVELFQAGKRVAAHVRSSQRGGFTTVDEHRPKSHQRHLQWTPGRIIEWAGKIGKHCAQVVEQVMALRPHPEQGFRSCLGIIRLGKVHGEARLELACARALHFGTLTYRSIESILEGRLEQQPLEAELPFQTPTHDNVRGQTYFS